MKTTTKQQTKPEATRVADEKPDTDPEGETTAEVSRLREENEQLRTKINVAAAHRQITGELGRIGASSPELLFDSVKGDLQFAEDGSLQNASAITAMLRSRYPEQFGTQSFASIDAGAGVAQPPRLTKEALAKMSPSEIAALDWEDVKRTLSK